MKIIQPFFFGILAAFGALFFQLAIRIIFIGDGSLPDNFYTQISWLLLAVILIEEIFKFLLINKYRQEAENKKNFLLGSFLIGLGFSVVEISLLFSSEILTGPALYLGMLGVLCIHLATAGFVGIFLIQIDAASKKGGLVHLPSIILFVFLIHLLYNSFLIYNAQPYLIIAYLLALLIILAYKSRRALSAFAK